jgi:hypothetical protein
MRIRSILSTLILSAGLVGGCAQQAREPMPPENHPANPRAAEAPPAPTQPKLSGTINRDANAPAVDEATAAPVAYTCPHHPKVMEAEPGECPFCGMKLVPTASRNTSPVRGVQQQPPADTDTPADATPKGQEGHGAHEGHNK